MSMSGSNSSSGSGKYRNFRQITRDRLLYEMLRSVRGDSESHWKILILDKVTVKILSCACKSSDITDEGIHLVEGIYNRRQPFRNRDAIYFIQPTNENVVMLMSDMSRDMYRKAYVFFSSSTSRDLVNIITKEPTFLKKKIGALREMNLEYFAIDKQCFVTENEKALEQYFGDQDNDHRTGDACLNVMAARIATVFASLQELPLVRYRAAKSVDTNTMTTYHDLVPTKLAAGVWNYIIKYKTTIPNYPQTETCELLILDRSVDQIAPVIHEWTYGAMCHDLLNLEGNKYVVEVPSKSGNSSPENKVFLLDEHDPIWVELQDAHIAEASERLHGKMTSFAAKNGAAQIQQGSSSRGAELSAQELQKMVLALPQYSEQIEKLSLHVEIAQKVNKIIRERGLKELGQLEQDLVFGDAGTKEIMNFLRSKEGTSEEDKLRLLLIYTAIYPEIFEGEKGSELIQLARLSPDDIIAISNMKLLEEAQSETKKSKIATVFSLKFDVVPKKRHAARKDRSGEEAAWQLSRFYPMIEDLVEKLCKGELPNNEYPCMNEPSPSFQRSGPAASSFGDSVGQSMRTRRPTWARGRNSDDGYSSDSFKRHESSEIQKMGQRIFIFIVGGATRSELRACHTLSEKFKREIVLGSSSIDDPAEFITKLKMLPVNDVDDISVDDIEI